MRERQREPEQISVGGRESVSEWGSQGVSKNRTYRAPPEEELKIIGELFLFFYWSHFCGGHFWKSASESHFHLMKYLYFMMKIIIFTKYLSKSLKTFIGYSLRPFWKGENHIRKLEKIYFGIYYYFGVKKMPPKMIWYALISWKWPFWGPIYTPRPKIKKSLDKIIFQIYYYGSPLFKMALKNILWMVLSIK